MMSNLDSTKKIVFLDYHGVLTDLTKKSLTSPPNIKFVRDGSLRAIQLLSDYYLFVISNQAGIAFGDYSLNQLNQAISVFIKDLQSRSIRLIDFFYCPHHPKAKILLYKTPCICRKPNPYFIHKALSSHNTMSTNCVFVGDNLETDIACAFDAGIKSIWINSSNILPYVNGLSPDATCSTLLKAVPIIKLFLTESANFSK
jgi:D-glycero-D-manno-heptose 1,7-bisphosphate phosphatase